MLLSYSQLVEEEIMDSLSGKKLLILGATPNEICVVERAKELGVYTIVTDYNTDHTVSPAKDAADEYWDVSWSDIDTLESLCREKQVDGIVAGYSEIRVDNLIKLCDRLGLPCYVRDDQLEITRNKDKFKEECRRFGIPVIREYNNLKDVCRFPVIVKPTDRAGSIGVSIANNQEEFEAAYAYAMEMSLKKKVIVEDYITDCTEFDVHYGIIGGNIFLLSSDDVIHAQMDEEEGKVIQSGWICPERFQDRYLVDVDPQMRKMIQNIGIQNGTIFFSGFVSNTGEFRFFECGFRLWGPQEYNYTERKGLVNYLDIYIMYALCGDCSRIVASKDINQDLKYVALWLYSKAGTIAQINGFQAVKSHPVCSQAILYGRINQVCSEDKAILSRLALFEFCSESPQELQDAVDFAYHNFKVIGANGEDMIYDRIPTEHIPTWWD